MLNVSSAVKAKFQSDYCRKELKITIGATVLTNEAIYKDGFKLTESVMDGTVEFVGCIASILEFKISTLSLPKGNYKGQTVVAEVAVYLNENTLSSYVPLFHGFVDECTKSADGYYQQFVCYDRLAYLSDEPGYNMYKAAFNGSSISLETFRDAIVLDCGMDAVNSQTLPNDDIIFKKRKRNKDVTAMALLRHIAQINGAFGILNRDNRFEFRQIDDAADPESIPYYRDLKYSDYVVRPVGDSTANPPTGSITIRTSSQDAGITVDWTNYQQYAGTDPGWSDESQDTYLVDDDDADVVVDSYIIESNLIAYKLKASKKRVIGANILASLGHDAVFREYSVKCNGLPYVECCDKVLFTKGDSTQIEFVVTKRVLEGIQNMTDTYSCTITAQDANNKTFVSNVDNSTNSLGGNPDEALGLTEKTITENGTYSALDDGAEGYSQVTVNVPDGGVTPDYLSIENATALEQLTAGDCVYVTTTSQGDATLISTNIESRNGIAVDGDDIYTFDKNTLSIMKQTGLNGTKSVYISSVYSTSTCNMSRNLIAYRDSDNLLHFINLRTGIDVAFTSNSGSPVSTSLDFVYLEEYVDGVQRRWRSIDTGQLVPAENDPVVRSNETGSVVVSSSVYYNLWFNQNYVREYNFNILSRTLTLQYRIINAMWTVWGSKLICFTYSDKVLGYYDMQGASDGDTLTFTPILDQNGNQITVVTSPNSIQYNTEGTKVWADLNANGLAVISSDMTAIVYADIKSANVYANMFGDYFYLKNGGVYLLGSNKYMGKTHAKNHVGMLGYVAFNYEVNEVGSAYILFS